MVSKATPYVLVNMNKAARLANARLWKILENPQVHFLFLNSPYNRIIAKNRPRTITTNSPCTCALSVVSTYSVPTKIKNNIMIVVIIYPPEIEESNLLYKLFYSRVVKIRTLLFLPILSNSPSS